MRKDNTLLELKQRIAEFINMNPSEFVLKRNMVQREFKNLASKLSELGLNSGAVLKVERGRPH
jgi:Fe2+ transport system protein FeoA